MTATRCPGHGLDQPEAPLEEKVRAVKELAPEPGIRVFEDDE